MDARTGRRQKRISKRQEEKTAAELGGRTQANSGATPMGGGGDVRVRGQYRVECKFTEGSSYVLKLSELDKLKKQANSVAEIPVFQFEFRTPGHPRARASYAVTFGDHAPDWAPFKSIQTFAGSVKFGEKDLQEVFSQVVTLGVPVNGGEILHETRNDCVQLMFLKDDRRGCWAKSFRIRPWEAFLKEQGEQDA
jgi:hypothetical protein